MLAYFGEIRSAGTGTWVGIYVHSSCSWSFFTSLLLPEDDVVAVLKPLRAVVAGLSHQARGVRWGGVGGCS